MYPSYANAADAEDVGRFPILISLSQKCITTEIDASEIDICASATITRHWRIPIETRIV